MPNVIVSNHPLLLHKLTLLRNKETNSQQFRELVRELSILLAYEASQDFLCKPVEVETPMGIAKGYETIEKIGLIPILRAGLGMVQGFWELIPSAEVWHIGLYRDEKTLKPVEYYNKLPVEPTVSVCLVLDPMLATGGSAVVAASRLKSWGVKRIKFLGLFAAPEGLKNLAAHHPDVEIFVGAVDSHLNDRGYIVPGMGDAGDRQFSGA